MQARYRYGLIAAFFAAFLILAPFVIIFVTGIKYDFKNRTFVKTGTISAATDPKGAEIFLNNKAAGKTPKTIRFLVPGNYNVQIHKDGYFDWNKELSVKPQLVTAINNSTKNLTLFFSKPNISEISADVTNFFAGQNKIIYLTTNALYLENIDDPEVQQSLALPKNLAGTLASAKNSTAANNLMPNILASPDEKYYLIFNDLYYGIFDAGQNKFFDITALINASASSNASVNSPNFQFSNNDNLYFLAKLKLWQIDWQAQTKINILQNIAAYFVSSNAIYFLMPNYPAVTLGATSRIALLTAPLSNLSQSLLLGSVANFNTAKIYLSNQNQLFILADKSLYSFSNNMQSIVDFVSDVQIYNQLGLILFAGNNEIGFYDYLNDKVSSLTRSSAQIKNPVAFPDLGWVFYEDNSRLQNIEIDNRDHQNNYTFSQVSDNAKFYIDAAARNIFLLDNGVLSKINIR
jgi:hypothetical protein